MASGATKPASNISNCKFKKRWTNKQCGWYLCVCSKKRPPKAWHFYELYRLRQIKLKQAVSGLLARIRWKQQNNGKVMSVLIEWFQ